MNTAWIAVIGTLGGVVTTALVGLIGTRLTMNGQRDQARAQRNHEARNKIRDERRAAFVAYLSAYQALLGRAIEAMELSAAEPATTEASRTASVSELIAGRSADQERSDFTRAYEQLLITADRRETIDAARAATATVWDVVRAVGSQDAFDEAEERARGPRRLLRERMREELGVAGA